MGSQDTIFDKILRNEVPNWKVWQDDKHLAFLTPFPNTPGVTIVIPKTNPGDYVFDVTDDVYIDLLKATKIVAKALEKVFNTKIALIFEGTGVPYLHAKLYPMHNVYKFDESKMPSEPVFSQDYQGYLITQSGPKMDAAELNLLQQVIKDALTS